MEIKKIAITKIELTDEEVENFNAEMDMIFEFIDANCWDSMKTLRDIKDLL